MKHVWLLFFLIMAAPALAQEDFAALMKRGDQLDAQLKTKEALAVYLEAEKLDPNNAELLHRIAKQYGESQNDVPSKEEKRKIGMTALEYSKRAIVSDPKSSMAQLATAVSYGRVAPYLDNKTKIAYSKLVKEYAEKARELDPKGNDLVYHVLGAWNYELANLNPVLRAVAQLIYGKLPNASNEAAVENFKKAIDLNPRRLANHIELGRAYAAMGKKEEARAALEKGLSLPNRQRDDPETKDRGRAALKKL
jgi:tetratricopeptide (TPR) repeat protein